tara:strand:+ start:4320 stop:4943 length:624 start_codon:yes stop_codon:yes gene_type:complete
MILLGLSLALLVIVAWNDDVSRFDEFKERIAPYKREIYYFIPSGFVLITVAAYLTKQGKRLLFPIATVIILISGLSLGASTFSKQNDHVWGVEINGPSDLSGIAEISPQVRARETWLTYMRLEPYIGGKTIFIDERINPSYLNAFARANVHVDRGHDSTFVPFSQMSAMEIVFEGPIYKNRKLLLFGEGENYSFYSTADRDYVVANK